MCAFRPSYRACCGKNSISPCTQDSRNGRIFYSSINRLLAIAWYSLCRSLRLYVSFLSTEVYEKQYLRTRNLNWKFFKEFSRFKYWILCQATPGVGGVFFRYKFYRKTTPVVGDWRFCTQFRHRMPTPCNGGVGNTVFANADTLWGTPGGGGGKGEQRWNNEKQINERECI